MAITEARKRAVAYACHEVRKLKEEAGDTFSRAFRQRHGDEVCSRQNWEQATQILESPPTIRHAELRELRDRRQRLTKRTPTDADLGRM